MCDDDHKMVISLVTSHMVTARLASRHEDCGRRDA